MALDSAAAASEETVTETQAGSNAQAPLTMTVVDPASPSETTPVAPPEMSP
jgi:hypothetical protein